LSHLRQELSTVVDRVGALHGEARRRERLRGVETIAKIRRAYFVQKKLIASGAIAWRSRFIHGSAACKIVNKSGEGFALDIILGICRSHRISHFFYRHVFDINTPGLSAGVSTWFQTHLC
jgi:hypothetical protein